MLHYRNPVSLPIAIQQSNKTDRAERGSCSSQRSPVAKRVIPIDRVRRNATGDFVIRRVDQTRLNVGLTTVRIRRIAPKRRGSVEETQQTSIRAFVRLIRSVTVDDVLRSSNPAIGVLQYIWTRPVSSDRSVRDSLEDSSAHQRQCTYLSSPSRIHGTAPGIQSSYEAGIAGGWPRASVEMFERTDICATPRRLGVVPYDHRFDRSDIASPVVAVQGHSPGVGQGIGVGLNRFSTPQNRHMVRLLAAARNHGTGELVPADALGLRRVSTARMASWNEAPGWVLW